jgi:hypothetical protein
MLKDKVFHFSMLCVVQKQTELGIAVRFITCQPKEDRHELVTDNTPSKFFLQHSCHGDYGIFAIYQQGLLQPPIADEPLSVRRTSGCSSNKRHARSLRKRFPRQADR